MAQIDIAPFGAWKSPITSDLIVAETIGLGDIVLDGEEVYWLETRPSEGGRGVVVRRSPNGHTTDITPKAFYVRTRVHEYGGGAYTVHRGTLYFSNFPDQRLYRQAPGEAPEPLMTGNGVRFADFVADPRRERLIGVCEDHRGNGEPKNTLVAIRLDGAGNPEARDDPGVVLAAGADFYASPALSPEGARLAWLSWNHPNMPWDGTELWVAKLDKTGGLAEPQRVAGGSEESIFQPQWGPDGTLYFVSDRNGWWNLYAWRNGQVRALKEMKAEFGLPQWVFALSTYGFDAAGRVLCAYSENGEWRLARLSPETGVFEPLDIPYTSVSGVRCSGNRVVFHGGSPTEETAVVALDLGTGSVTVLKRTSALTIDPGYFSVPKPIEFPSQGEQTAHAFFYAPLNRDFRAPAGERPPLLVKCHGGPTAATRSTLSLGTQYWTSRGFAVLDVNYGGSTGYGRAYHERLDGQWGSVDVDDCINATRHVIEMGWADGGRCAIRGSSAGGYTTLAALTFGHFFRAGASHYGISDLEALTRDTHKFESRYLDRMIGSYPEARALYRERSPIHHAERLSAPVIFFQGLDDKVVPPDQAVRMVDALRQKGIPVAYVPFAGEGHGFRQAATIKRALEAELYFYSRIFDFPLAEPIESVVIDNLTSQ